MAGVMSAVHASIRVLEALLRRGGFMLATGYGYAALSCGARGTRY